MRCLVVGGGSIGQRHISNLKLLGHSDIVCLKRSYDSSFAKKYDVQVITNYEEAAKKNVDVLIVCTPTALHLDALEFGVTHDLPVFMEKPLTDSASNLIRAKTLLSSYTNVFFIGFMLRFHRLVTEMKSILETNMLGEVFNARFEFGSYLPYWHADEDYRESYASRKDLGGGVVNTITHELDLIQYFFGSPRSISCISQNLGYLDIEVEEQCDAIFEYSNKVVSLHLDYLQKDYDRRIRVLCEEGVVQWNWHDNYILVNEHQKQIRKIVNEEKFDVNQLYMDELKHFFELIDHSQKRHELNHEHAIANSELMMAMHQASVRGKKIELI